MTTWLHTVWELSIQLGLYETIALTEAAIMPFMNLDELDSYKNEKRKLEGLLPTLELSPGSSWNTSSQFGGKCNKREECKAQSPSEDEMNSRSKLFSEPNVYCDPYTCGFSRPPVSSVFQR